MKVLSYSFILEHLVLLGFGRLLLGRIYAALPETSVFLSYRPNERITSPLELFSFVYLVQGPHGRRCTSRLC